LSDAGAKLTLTINPAFSHEPIRALARIVWLKKEAAQYRIGVAYESIDPRARRRLIVYAKRRLWAGRLTSTLGLALLAALAGLAVHNHSLTRENLRLAQQLREGAVQRSQVAGELVSLSDNRGALETELKALRAENARLEGAIEGMNTESAEFLTQKLAYENELKRSRAREAAILSDLVEVRKDQEALRASYETLEAGGRESASVVGRWMSQWLAAHQNVKTGLVASFEGDPALEDTAFTYDQSLAAQAFLISGDLSRAEKVLSFYDSRAKSGDGAFANAYDTLGGNRQETVVHTGPNLWIGLAALQHARQTGDPRFIPMAVRVGDWAMRLQDSEGGLPGGPGLAWYSTEHNLDAYAFFGRLAELTGEEKYTRARDAVLAWLKQYAYSNRGQPVNRGKGDATIATDTFGWSIAAIGPEKLYEMGFDPEAILEFAEEHCQVDVSFRHPGGQTLAVRGFDFAKARHLGRGGVLSTEWTAQMIVSYQVLARYFRSLGNPEKARRYLEKAGFYLNELQKMILTSPSRTGQGRGCLPYASADDAETGHGWRTPKGSSTGSVAATAYGLFAWKGYNPFEWPREEARDAGL
jgi:hypothetical protein